MKKSKKMNNKGYMLIEIILASAIAFGLAYFMLELTIKLKNKNDDLLVETMVMTDNAIISNAIMEYLNKNAKDDNFECQEDTINFDDDKNVISIGGKFITSLNEYVKLDGEKIVCENDNGIVHVFLPLEVTQQSDSNYNIDLYYKIKPQVLEGQNLEVELNEATVDLGGYVG